MKVQKMVVSVKTYDYYHHKFNFGNFFQLPCKTVKNLKVKFRSKFNRGYLQSAVWKALYNFNPIDDGSFFRGCSWIDGGGGGAKRHPSLKYVLHILQWWPLAQLYLTQRKFKQYVNHVTHHLSFDGISIFSPKIRKILLYQEIQI